MDSGLICYLGLGSNIGDRRDWIELALGSIANITAASSLYTSSAVEMADGSDDFLNMVVQVKTELDPYELLDQVHKIEDKAQRLRPYPNAPRTLDIDLIYSEGLSIRSPQLTLPHPRARYRLFVLVPLAELDQVAANAVYGDNFSIEQYRSGAYDHLFKGQRLEKFDGPPCF